MAALAVDQPGLHRQIDQISIDRDDVSLDFAKPKIDFGQCMFAAPLHHARLKHTCRRYQANRAGDERSFELGRLRLVTQDCHDGGGIDHRQLGIPFSS
jgi:hypothetical protein